MAIDCLCVPLCGEPGTTLFAIHYTVDRSEPTATSPTYEMPLQIEVTTTVRALVLIDGRRAVRSAAEFRRGKKPRCEESLE